MIIINIFCLFYYDLMRKTKEYITKLREKIKVKRKLMMTQEKYNSPPPTFFRSLRENKIPSIIFYFQNQENSLIFY